MRRRSTGARKRRIPEVSEAVFRFLADDSSYADSEDHNQFELLGLRHPTTDEHSWGRYVRLWHACRDPLCQLT